MSPISPSLFLLSLKSQHHHRPEDVVDLTYLTVAMVHLFWFHSFLSSLLHKQSKPPGTLGCHLCGTRILHVAPKQFFNRGDVVRATIIDEWPMALTYGLKKRKTKEGGSLFFVCL
jgi:hypothetical protein